MREVNPAWAILLAAGSGQRLRGASGGVFKQFITWRGKPLYWHSALAISRCPLIAGIVLVFPEAHMESESKRFQELLNEKAIGIEWRVCAGGERRQDSVRLGLEKVPRDCGIVAVHDAARPFLTPALVGKVFAALDDDCPGAIPAIPVTDTIKTVNDAGIVECTLPRQYLRAIQTPQAFDAAILKSVHAAALRDGIEGTDDASLLENYGYKTRVVEGDAVNVKITNPEDLKLLSQTSGEFLPLAGFGYDVHKFGGNNPLILGGVHVPHNNGLLAHSDGDVLLHALIDAILGCAGLGDIGQHFPDSDSSLAGISSALLLDETLRMIGKENIALINADLTIVAQRPRLEPWKTEIRNNVARLLSLPKDRVNIKATTEEGLGFTGTGEGIKAYASVMAMRVRQGG